jgi:hypothetical protein
MTSICRHLRRVGKILRAPVAVLTTAVAVFAAVTFLDDFSVPGNQLDTSKWTTEFGPPSFLGRTQLRDWVNGSNVGPFVVMDGSAQLALDTFNPTGFSMYGTHAKTLMSFQPTPTTDYVLTVRMRVGGQHGGIVYGVYFYGCGSGPCNTSHDELDIEIVTNHLQSVQLNRYAAEPLGAGHGLIKDLPPGFDQLAFHEWTIRWGLSHATYSVDGIELFSTPEFIPQGAMQANIIAWAPASDWADAYDSSLQPTMANGNQHFAALVDYVTVVPVATTSGAPTTTMLASSSSTSAYGQSVTFTATVAPSSATGTVAFMDGSSPLGTGTLSAGTATYSTSMLTAGAHSITAGYGGDSAHSGSASSAITQTVNKANTTTGLSSTPNPSVSLQPVTFTATVAPTSATGTVTFQDGSTTLGAGALSGGTATYTTSSLTAGTRSITATYGGDSLYSGSTSAAMIQIVNQTRRRSVRH